MQVSMLPSAAIHYFISFGETLRKMYLVNWFLNRAQIMQVHWRAVYLNSRLSTSYQYHDFYGYFIPAKNE